MSMRYCVCGVFLKLWLGLLPLARAESEPAKTAPDVSAAAAEAKVDFQAGVCFTHNYSLETGYGSQGAAESLAEIRALGANYVSISPIGYGFNLHDPRVFGYTGENPALTPDRIRKTIRDAHKAGLKVLLNPHIWLGMYGAPGEWRGEIAMQSDADWDHWFRDYTAFICFFARMAEQEGVEIFCVGSELGQATKARPRSWRGVIAAVRSVYSGLCTYSANWAGEYERIPFWDALDFAGLSAYFPLKGADTGEKGIEAAALRDILAGFSHRIGKPVVFLELGFRSIAGGGNEPARWQDEGGAVSDLEAQKECYQVIFQTFWEEPWFAGLYLWNWYSDLAYTKNFATDFQFRRKPAAGVVEEYFSRRRRTAYREILPAPPRSEGETELAP